jgi:hypothetical protein
MECSTCGFSNKHCPDHFLDCRAYRRELDINESVCYFDEVPEHYRTFEEVQELARKKAEKYEKKIMPKW